MYDLHNFRASSILEGNPVALIRGQQCLADRRNPTDGVRFEIEFVNTDDRIGFGPAFFIFYRHRCAEANALRRRFRRIDNMDRCQSVSITMRVNNPYRVRPLESMACR